MSKWVPVKDKKAECYECGAGYEKLEYRNPFYEVDNLLDIAFTEVEVKCKECGAHDSHPDSVMMDRPSFGGGIGD